MPQTPSFFRDVQLRIADRPTDQLIERDSWATAVETLFATEDLFAIWGQEPGDELAGLLTSAVR